MYTTKFASLPQVLILNINRAMLGKPLYDNIITFEKTLDVNEFVDKNNYIGLEILRILAIIILL